MKTKHKETGRSVANFNRYRYYAEKAAKAERAGDYEDAISYWELAALSANEQNKAWAISRKEFCERMKDRPFLTEE